MAPPSDFLNYAPGTWGPENIQGLLAHGHSWPFPAELIGHCEKDGKEFMTRDKINTPIEHTIVAVLFHADAATHDELAPKVNEKPSGGYELYAPPFFSREMRHQAMTKPIPPQTDWRTTKGRSIA